MSGAASEADLIRVVLADANVLYSRVLRVGDGFEEHADGHAATTFVPYWADDHSYVEPKLGEVGERPVAAPTAASTPARRRSACEHHAAAAAHAGRWPCRLTSTASVGSVHVWERRCGQCGDLFTGFMQPTLYLSTVMIRRPYDRKQYTTS
jgi:hypothetical protein